MRRGYRGQFARHVRLSVPVVCVVTGEVGSGGALGIGIGQPDTDSRKMPTFPSLRLRLRPPSGAVPRRTAKAAEALN